MTKAQYELIQAGQPKAPPINLIRISGNRSLTASLKAFGQDCFISNIKKIQQEYSHPQTGLTISLRHATTTESILLASCDFVNRAKPQILDPGWLQAGWIVRTSEGVFANPPTQNGEIITDEQKLKYFLRRTRPVKVGNGNLYVVSNAQNLRDFGFAEYGSFTKGVQDVECFITGGLARLLEHTEKPAENLNNLASQRNYPKGINVWSFDSIDNPILRCVGLYSDGSLDNEGLGIDGYHLGGDGDGFAFAVLDESAEGTER